MKISFWEYSFIQVRRCDSLGIKSSWSKDINTLEETKVTEIGFGEIYLCHTISYQSLFFN